MKNHLISGLTWTAIQMYNWTYKNLPPFIFDIKITMNPREVQLVKRKPRWFAIPCLIVYFASVSMTFIGVPRNLLQIFEARNQAAMSILTASIGLLQLFFLEYVAACNRTLWRTSHCIPFINSMINNRLPYRKSVY